jgi:hypothetical protein
MHCLRYCVLAAIVALGLSASTASAQGIGICNNSFGNLNAFGSSGNLYGSGYLFVPPYFAIHPPVYYSHQYYRPYGWTPFAQSSYQSPVVLRPEPRMVINPHVPAAQVKAKPAEDSTARSEMIFNPFYVKAEETGQGRLASQQP